MRGLKTCWHNAKKNELRWFQPGKSSRMLQGLWANDSEHLQLAVSWIHHEHDAVHSERGLGNVGGDDAFPHAVRSLAQREVQSRWSFSLIYIVTRLKGHRGLVGYKPSGRSWPGGRRAAESRLAARREQERFPAPPAAPRSGQMSPGRTHKWRGHTDGADSVSFPCRNIGKLFSVISRLVESYLSPSSQDGHVTSMSSWPGMKMRMSPINPLRWICRACFTAAST